MTKLLNTIDTALDECVDGIMSAEPGRYVKVDEQSGHTLYRSDLAPDKVRIIISGGGGYGPMFLGFVGPGLADAGCEGDFNCAPTAYALYNVAKTMDSGCGVLFLTNNFTGDFLNNDMAQELLLSEGISSHVCYVNDDIFSARGEPSEKRGGLCGMALLIKVASAAAAAGLPLDEVNRIVQKANDRLRSVTICFNEKSHELEFGNGFSGEAPAKTAVFTTVDNLAAQAVEYLLPELSRYSEGSHIHFTVNRMRYMTYLESYVVLNAVKKQLGLAGCSMGACSTGIYFDAFASNGCIISALAADEELAGYLAPVSRYDFAL